MARGQSEYERSPLSGLLSIVVWLGTASAWWVTSSYAGSLTLLIPVAFAVVLGLLALGLLALAGGHRGRLITVFPSALLAAHITWMALGRYYAGRLLTADLAPVALLVESLGIAWLLVRPDWLPVAALSVFQALAAAVNLYAFFYMPLGDYEHRALAVHLFFRGFALLFLWVGLYGVYRRPHAV